MTAPPPVSPNPSNPEVIDDLRQRLRALGYLDAGVDRFVLGSARRSERPVALAASASLRIGCLAAVLLGPAAAVGLAARLPGLVTGPRDAVVAAVYLGILFGVCAAVASFVASLAASWMATRTALTGPRLERRARMLSLAAGIVVSAGSLAYLTLWWRTANAGLGWAAPVWTVFALVVAAVISLLLGHAVTVTALVMTMMRPERDVGSAGVPGASWKASIAGGAIAFAGAAILLFATAGGDRPDGSPAALTVSSPGATVVVLAVDGFDARLYERFRSAVPTTGPGLSTAVFDSARADLAPFESRDPARLWTTIATGVRPETHGVSALETRRVAGLQGRLGSGSTARVIGTATDVLRLTRPAIASNFERRVKTFWEVAEQAGLRTGVVNWWATWPAAASDGRVITDRAVLRLERGGPLDAEIAPADLYEPLKARWPEIRARARQQAQERLAPTEQRESPIVTGELEAVLTRSAELDASMIQLANTIAQDGKLDLLVVYLPGLDIAQYTLLGGESGAPPSELGARVAALQRYYTFLTSLTGASIGDAVSRHQRLFVITQAGRQHEGFGILAALGPGLRAGGHVSAVRATVLDVAPTILHALGVPIARDLDGRVVTDLFERETLERHPVREIDSYGLRGTISAVRGGIPLDQETIDRLRSLGYVK
jgi:type I phosphodiesterase/nucleotide pyrophosphatase